MRKAALVVLMAMSGAAVAAPRDWSVILPPGFVDGTAEAIASPAVIATAKQVTDRGGRFEATQYHSADGSIVLFVMIIEPAEQPPSIAELEETEVKARARTAQDGTETSYVVDRTPLLITSTQRLTSPLAPVVNRRWIGLLRSGRGRLIGAACIGEPVSCEPLLATIKIDETELVPLTTLGGERTTSGGAYRIVMGVLFALVALALVLLVRRRRPASR